MNPEERELKIRFDSIQSYYDLDDLLANDSYKKALEFHHKSPWFIYYLFRPRGSRSLHMCLSDDGRFHMRDFQKQIEYIAEQIDETTGSVLEIGAGGGGRIKRLAKRYPNVTFTAIVLPERHFPRKHLPKNVKLVRLDYDDITKLPKASFDLVFGIETLRHAENKNQIIEQIHKVLKPGGKMILFDVYESQPQKEMTDFEKYATKTTLAVMRINASDQYIGDLKKHLAAHRFENIEVANLTGKTKPGLWRLEKKSRFYFSHPYYARTLRRMLPEDVILNIIAGWLMNQAFDNNHLLQYDRITAVKKEAK